MKSGFVAILGRPNVGKSTLLNAILKKKVSIVTDKSQTTRNQIKGIYNDEECQIVFTDTPGIHKPHQRLGQEMNNMAYSAAHDVEANILVVDASLDFGKGDQYLIDHLDIKKTPLIIVFNKIDLVKIDVVQKRKEIYLKALPHAKIIDTVASEGFNADEVIKAIKEVLPEGPAYYPTDVLTDKDDIFQIKEIIREKILNTLKDEVPHCVAIYLNNIDYDSKPICIYGNIIVEKESQKPIVIGAKGSRIREIGSAARKDIEALLGQHIRLELFVKVESDWRNQDQLLKTYGYKNEK